MFDYDEECPKCQDVNWTVELVDQTARETAPRTGRFLAWDDTHQITCNTCSHEFEHVSYNEVEE